MNRRNFFQSIMAGIGALVGHKYLPKTDIEKAHEKLDEALPKLWPQFLTQKDFNNCFEKAWRTTTTYYPDGSVVQYCYKYDDGDMVIDWWRRIEPRELSTDAKTDKTTD